MKRNMKRWMFLCVGFVLILQTLWPVGITSAHPTSLLSENEEQKQGIEDNDIEDNDIEDNDIEEDDEIEDSINLLEESIENPVKEMEEPSILEEQQNVEQLSRDEQSQNEEEEQTSSITDSLAVPIWKTAVRAVKAYTDGSVEYEMEFRHFPTENNEKIALEEATFFMILPEGATFVQATFGGVYEPEHQWIKWENPGGIATNHPNFQNDTPRRVNVKVKFEEVVESVTVSGYATYTPEGMKRQTTERAEWVHGFTDERPEVDNRIVIKGELQSQSIHETLLTGKKDNYEVHYSISGLETSYEHLRLVVTMPEQVNFDTHVQLTADFKGYHYNSETRQFIFEFQEGVNGSTGILRISNIHFPNIVTPDGTAAEIQMHIEGEGFEPIHVEPARLVAKASSDWNIVKKKFKPGVDPYPGEYVEYSLELSNASKSEFGLLKVDEMTLVDKLPEEAIFVEAYELPPNYSERIPGTYNEATHTVHFDIASPDQTKGADNTKEFRVIVKYPDWTERVEGWHEDKNDLTDEEREWLESIQQKKVTNEATLSYEPLGQPLVKKETSLTHGFSLDIALPWDYVYTDKSVKTYQQEAAPGQDVTFYMNASNFSNVTLPKGEIIDMTPDGLRLKEVVTGIYRGVETYDVYYTTSSKPSGTDWHIWQKDHPAHYYSTLQVSDLGIDEPITGIKIAFKEISPLFYTITSFSPTYTVDESFSFPKDVDRVPVRNIATLQAEYKGGFSKDFYADMVVVQKRPLLSLTASTLENTIKPKEPFNYSFKIENKDYSSADLKNPIIEVLLPPSITHTAWNWSLADSVERPASEQIPKPQYEVEKVGEQEKLIFYWDESNPYTLPIGETFNLHFNASIKEGSMKGEAIADFRVHSNEHPRIGDFDYAQIGTLDDGREYVYTDYGIQINSKESLQATKHVRSVEPVDAFSERLDVAHVERGGQMIYTIMLENKGNEPLESLRVVDVFPYEGDRGVHVNGKRHSEWQPLFNSMKVVPDGWTVSYSETEKVNYNSTEEWSSVMNRPSDVRAIRFESNNSLLNPGEKVFFEWIMDVPKDGEGIAWNSFAVGGKVLGASTALFPTEPRKVGALLPKREVGQVLIEKRDAKTKQPLEGVVFTLTDGELTKTTEPTDATGRVTITHLPTGTYTVTEVKTPEGYEPYDEPISVFIAPSQTARLVVENFPTTGPITKNVQLLKKDCATGETLTGATFQLHDGKTVIGTYETDASGVIHLVGLTPGATYTLKELVAPEGYERLTEPVTITLTDDTADETFDICNKRSIIDGTITVVKKDRVTGQILPGAIFELQTEDGTVVAREATDENGTATFQSLALDQSYIVIEAQAPSGYQLDKEPKQVMLGKNNPTITIDVLNEPIGTVQLVKKDDQTDELLEGAQFTFTHIETNTSYRATTNSEGVASLQLPVGLYNIVETRAPEGYIRTDIVTPVEVAHNDTIVIHRTNTKETPSNPVELVGSAQLIKVDKDDTDKRLEGAIFTLEQEGIVVRENLKTNKNGEIIVNDLAPGTYTFVEKQAPSGYQLSESSSVVVVVKEQSCTTVYAMNEKEQSAGGELPTEVYGSLILQKVDSSLPTKGLQGAVFQLTNQEGFNKTVTTNESGRAEFTELPIGAYEVKEVKAPDGYQLSSLTWAVHIRADETIEKIIPNDPVEEIPKKGELILSKVDAEQINQPLEGAIFQLFDENGKRVGEERTTNPDGTIRWSDLSYGTYTMVELKAPKGYVLDETPHFIVIDTSHVERTVTNEKVETTPPKTGKIKLLKQDRVTKKPLAGATFHIYGPDGVLVKADVPTDLEGQLLVDHLPIGTYTIVESRAPTGYVLDTSVHILEVTANATSKVTIYNDPLVIPPVTGSIYLKKVDDITKDALQGAMFTLVDATGKPVRTQLMTDENGVILVEGLQEGTYAFIETRAPKGYVLDTTPFTVQVNNDQVTAYEIGNSKEQPVNPEEPGNGGTAPPDPEEPGNGGTVPPDPEEPRSGTLRVIKSDRDDQANQLAGAIFELYTLSGNRVGEPLITQEDGIAVMDMLPVGTYYLMEVQAPDGYVKDPNPKEIVIENDHTMTVHWFNRKKEEPVLPTTSTIHLIKVDADTQVPLPGAIFELRDHTGYPVSERQVSDASGRAEWRDIPFGLYQVVEIKAPIGYQLNDTIQQINLQTQGTELIFENKKKSSSGGGEPTHPVDPENPGNGGSDLTRPVDPENPGSGGGDPTRPVDPENPGSGGSDPTRPVDPENPGSGGSDPTRPVDPENPGSGGSDPTRPVDPEDPISGGSDPDHPVNDETVSEDSATPNDSTSKNPNQSLGNILPQTGEERFIWSIGVGIILILVGWIIFRRRPNL